MTQLAVAVERFIPAAGSNTPFWATKMPPGFRQRLQAAFIKGEGKQAASLSIGTVLEMITSKGLMEFDYQNSPSPITSVKRGSS